MKKSYLFLLIPLIGFSNGLHAQLKEGYRGFVEVRALGTTNNIVPFWMRSNRNGSIPLSGLSLSGIVGLHKDYEQPILSDMTEGRTKFIDWGFGVEGRANGGKNSNLILVESFLKAKASIFELKVGRTRDVVGFNGDTTLSSGNFSISGNALGIPGVELGISEYYRIPIFDGLFSIKGGLKHGWVGKVKILDSIGALAPSTDIFYLNDTHPQTYLHQKSFYGRLGKKDWRFSLFGGFNHLVYWGNEKNAYGDNFKLSPFETFFYVATGKAYGAKGVPTSKIGNQLGSIDLAASYEFPNHKLTIYRQNFYDVGALAKLANIRDGLNGISLTNKNAEGDPVTWERLLLEFFYSKNQAGYPSSIPTKSGDEDYYNNFYYKDGWSYKGLGLGSPLITQRKHARSGQALFRNDYFMNNRLWAINVGISGKLNSWRYTSKITFSRNYGTFATSPYGNSTGIIRDPQTTNLFQTVNQGSVYLEASKTFKNDYNIGFIYAGDLGRLLNNSQGLSLNLRRKF
jgi:hypothetical protein